MRIPAITRGIDNRSSDTALPEGAVSDAVNVDLNREGEALSRRGARLVASGERLHSLQATTNGLLVVADTVLNRVDADMLTPLLDLHDNAPVSYASTPGGTVLSNGRGLWQYDGEQVLPLTLPTPPAPMVSVNVTGGGLASAEYGVAVAYLRGQQESALSPAAFIRLSQPAAIRAAWPQPPPGIDSVRIYTTSPNGGVFYCADDVPVPATHKVIGAPGTGAQAPFADLAAMPPGDIVRYWNGRLLTAAGNTLCLSEPMAYHLHSPRHGFVQRPEQITMMAPTDGALFLATTRQTLVLRGRQPADWVVDNVDAGVAIPGSDISAPLDSFGGEWASTSAMGAAWLTTQGYVIGLPDGSVIAPQKRNLKLSPARRGVTVLNDRRITTYCEP